MNDEFDLATKNFLEGGKEKICLNKHFAHLFLKLGAKFTWQGGGWVVVKTVTEEK